MDPKYNALFTTINLLLGVGPIILPFRFFQAGVLLSSIWLLFISLISYKAALYIAEAMAKVEYIDTQQKLSVRRPLNGTPQGQDLDQSLLTIQGEAEHEPTSTLINNNKQSSTTQSTTPPTQLKKYDHIQQFGVLFGIKYKIVPSLIISIYLIGVGISKCIMTGNVLSKVFQDIDVLNSFLLWLGLFFLSGAAFSFKSIDSTKGLQFLIIIVRMISIVAMIGGAIYLMFKNGIKTITPAKGGIFNISAFAEIFSNLLFSLMCHHSLPGIAQPVKNTTDTNYFIRVSFIISTITLFIINFTACMAFGDQLGQHKYSFYNFDFKSDNDTLFIYYLVSFYVFLNVAAFSVYIIVIRTNILKIFKPQVNPMKYSKETIIPTIILLGFILVISVLLQQYIQYVLDFTGGVLGSVILFFIPAIQVYYARKRVHKQKEPKNYIEKLPFVIMVLGGIMMVFNLYEVIARIAGGGK